MSLRWDHQARRFNKRQKGGGVSNCGQIQSHLLFIDNHKSLELDGARAALTNFHSHLVRHFCDGNLDKQFKYAPRSIHLFNRNCRLFLSLKSMQLTVELNNNLVGPGFSLVDARIRHAHYLPQRLARVRYKDLHQEVLYSLPYLLQGQAHVNTSL